jgi:hypothetical protein
LALFVFILSTFTLPLRLARVPPALVASQKAPLFYQPLFYQSLSTYAIYLRALGIFLIGNF